MSVTPQPGDASPDDDRFSKRVAFEKTDDDEQIAYGAVLVPDRLDHQGDFLRSETIADLRESFDERVESGDAYPGVMHAVFPTDDVELVEDRQLDSEEDLGGKTLPAGTWVQGWKFTDDALWELVSDGVLGGNSIGGTAKGALYEPGEMPDDVEIPDPVQADLDDAGLSRDDIFAREITSGRIMEVSSVDYPAVPDATHEEHKSLAKASMALTENVVAARLYLEARGHDADDARRLAEYLNDKQASAAAGGKESGLIARARSLLGKSVSEKRSRESETADSDPRDSQSDERAESREGPSGSNSLNMSEDDIDEKFETFDERLDSIDEKLSTIADGAEPEDEEGSEKTSEGGSEPSIEEKVDQTAQAVIDISERVEQMADAQGVSQQADQTPGAGEEKSVWGDGSPFGGDN